MAVKSFIGLAPDWKGLSGTNSLAYYEYSYFTFEKSFISWAKQREIGEKRVSIIFLIKFKKGLDTKKSLFLFLLKL
jgi:hypothetical protein